MGQITTEKIDPLMRIQEEIKEVVRREEEHRQLTSGIVPTALGEYGDHNGNTAIGMDTGSNNDNDSNNSLSISPLPPSTLNNNNDGSLNTPSLPLSVNSKESLDDDSGISASPSPVNGVSAHANTLTSTTSANTNININDTNNNNNHNDHNDNNEALKVSSAHKDQRYIGPNCYSITPEPPRQILTRNVSTLPTMVGKPRQFAFNPAHKGVMQRFIASRGKLQLNGNNNHSNAAGNKIFLNTKTAATLLGTSLPSATSNTSASGTPSANGSGASLFADLKANGIIIPTVTMTPPVIERDADGKPIRRGYVPAEVKIQKEIKDLKQREHELKKRNKIRQSTPDLLDSIGNEALESDDEDSEEEHCRGPRELRTAKSIGELYDSVQFNLNSLSPRATPSPDFEGKMHFKGNNSMRPAISLAQLCDLTPEEAPSPHRLIAQWESRIQQNAQQNTSW